MLPAESSIEAAIEALKSSPGKFQRLVEKYAQFTYPHRFKDLAPSGRTPSDVTVKGWPDIYSIASDGRLDIVEATHSAAWPDHLEDDLEKAEALGPGRLAGFLFVAWDNDPSPLADHKKTNPRYEKLMGYRNRLIALDVPPAHISFVFKKQLVRTLTQPRFASVLKEILDLPCHSLPFRLIGQARELFGLPGRLDVFAPTDEEYLKGLVHRASIADEVESRLESRGWVWVRGRGAAGKTVLAIRVALGHESGFPPAYYLDLAKTDASASEALDVITTHADDQVIFIVDNVHLNEEFARDVLDHWRAASMGSRLLLLGRDVSVSDVRGSAHPLDEFKVDALTLEVRPADLAGVFLRLARRFLALPDYSSVPPHEALQRWHALFGGDLIAFSAAVALRIKGLTQRDWQLQAQDAAKYVQDTYLERASEAERLNLLRIAVLAQLEVDAPKDAIELANVRPFLQSGVVHQMVLGRGIQYEYYHLVHPGLGDLLLTAANYSSEELNQFISEQLRHVAQRNQFCGLQIVGRLESAKREQEAIAVLKSIIESDQGGMSALVVPGLQYLRRNYERLVRLSMFLESEVDQKLANSDRALSEGAMRTPLGDLASFLDYAGPKLPNVHRALTGVLAKPENLKKLSERALRSPLGALASFLDRAGRKLPNVHVALATMLAEPENLKRLSDAVLRTPLNDLASFLDYAERKLPNVHAALVDTLAQPDNLKKLSEGALRAPLHFLASFLDYAERELPNLHAALVDTLAQPDNLKKLSERALRTELHILASFLDYAKGKLPKVYVALVDTLAQPDNLKALSEGALRTPLGELAAFLDYAKRARPTVRTVSAGTLAQPENLEALFEAAAHRPALDSKASFLDYAERKLLAISKFLNSELAEPQAVNTLAKVACKSPLGALLKFLRAATFASAVVASIDRDEWDVSRLASRSEQPNFFSSLAGIFQSLGRPELAEAPARALISAAEPRDWHAPGIHLHHVSHVMRMGRAAGTEAVFRFLGRVCTTTWLGRQYAKASSGSIAASLFGLWGYYEQSVLDHFLIEAFKSRVSADLIYLDTLAPEDLSATLQLLGCSERIGLRIDNSLATWPEAAHIRETIRFAAPRGEMKTVGYVQIQLWLGLRAMTRLRPDGVTVQADLGDQILTLWRNSTGYTHKQKALNVWMIDWLQRCAEAKWTLVPDDTPFDDTAPLPVDQKH